MSNEAAYEQRVVAYLDILGFKDHVGRSANDASEIAAISGVLRYLDTEKASSRNGQPSLQAIGVETTTFSDHIVRSTLVRTPSSVYHTIMDVIQFQMAIVDFGFFVRGAITVGNLIHESDVVFGQALIEAYDIENSMAIYPRVVVTQSAIDEGAVNCEGRGPECEREAILELVRRSHDGLFHVNAISEHVEFHNWPEYVHWLKKYKDLVELEMRRARSMPVLQKYQWLATEYNCQIKSILDASQANHPNDGIDASWLIQQAI